MTNCLNRVRPGDLLVTKASRYCYLVTAPYRLGTHPRYGDVGYISIRVVNLDDNNNILVEHPGDTYIDLSYRRFLSKIIKSK